MLLFFDTQAFGYFHAFQGFLRASKIYLPEIPRVRVVHGVWTGGQKNYWAR